MQSKSWKERIRLEEQYRALVKNELTNPSEKKGLRHKFWTFLNSNFALWLLSAIFISGAGAAYTSYQSNQAEKIKNKETVEKLELELSFRFNEIKSRLQRFYIHIVDLPNADEARKVERAKNINITLDLLLQAPKEDYHYLYKEFSDMTIPTLYAELLRNVKDKSEQNKINVILMFFARDHYKEYLIDEDTIIIEKNIEKVFMTPKIKELDP